MKIELWSHYILSFGVIKPYAMSAVGLVN